MTNPTVSIIIPVYNAEKYIGRCIDSILEQSYTDWEVIAVNDGSTDGSLARLGTYADDERITVIDIPNGGVVNARQTALEHASGIYLTFVDADDYLPREAIALLVEKMQNMDADLVIGGYTLLWELDGRIKEINNKKDFSTPGDCLNYCIRNGETFLPVKMYRTKLFKESVHIPHDIIFMEDTIGIMQYLCRCRNVETIDSSIYVYFKNNGSASMTVRQKTVVSMLCVVEFIMKYMRTERCGDRCILAAKCGELLFNIMGHLYLIPEHAEQFSKLSEYYIEQHRTISGFRDRVLKLYLSYPRLAIVWHSGVVRLSKSKSAFKRIIWRMIHR